MQQQFPHQSSHFILPGPAGELELMTTYPDSSIAKRVVIVCHPHPQHGGTMTNKVVTTIARAFELLEIATVRFNFRGVGKSTGEYGHGKGEVEDLLAVMTWVKQVLPDHQIELAGFSFGACVSATVANQMPVQRLLSIAPAVHHCDFYSFNQISCPWLIIQGDQDEIVPFEEVQNFAKNPPAPLKLIVMEGVGHFFHGKLVELREIIINNL